MRKTLLIWTILVGCLLMQAAESFRFAQLTDIHLSRGSKGPEEDLLRSVHDINEQDSIDFVIITGDLTDAGDRASMEKAKECFDQLRVPYYVTSGNHETNWSESGCMDFDVVFGGNERQERGSRFAFTHKGITFVGFNSGPVLKMADGHVAPQDIQWVQEQLSQIPAGQKVIAITHYPLQEGDVDNWYDVTNMLHQFNTQCIIGGHYHRNLVFAADDIANVLCRSNLRGKDKVNGYSIIRVADDGIHFAEKTVGGEIREWSVIPYDSRGEKKDRPSYIVNEQYPKVTETWRVNIGIGVYGTPCLSGKQVMVGDDEGILHALDAKTGKEKWAYPTESRIFSSPASDGKCVYFGNTAGYIYCLNEKDGAVVWKIKTEKAVMGSPVITKVQGQSAVLIGGSDGCMRALRTKDGKEIWCFSGMKGYHATRPCVYDNKVYFGAWDCYMYALNLQDGSLAWKWSNGRSNDKFSPAACWPVAANGRLYFTAPDRVWTCLDAQTGKEIWRTNEHMVREAVGISADGKVVYSHCMEDSVVAVSAIGDAPTRIWKTNAGYGYDHNPSMMIERDGVVIFGNKNGVLYGIEAETGKILWKHKIGNSLVNTICPISGKECIVSSTDGSVVKLTINN